MTETSREAHRYIEQAGREWTQICPDSLLGLEVTIGIAQIMAIVDLTKKVEDLTHVICDMRDSR